MKLPPLLVFRVLGYFLWFLPLVAEFNILGLHPARDPAIGEITMAFGILMVLICNSVDVILEKLSENEIRNH